MTDQELIDKHDLTNHPMWTVGVGVWCQSIHHQEPFEKTTEPGQNRLLYVVREKPEREIPVRLAAMMPRADQAAMQSLYDKYWADRKPLDDKYWADLKPLYDKYRADRKPLDDKYRADLKPLYDKYWADRKPLDDKYEADRKPLDDKYRADRKPLDDKYWADRKPLDDKYDADRKPLYVGDWYDWEKRTLRFPDATVAE